MPVFLSPEWMDLLGAALPDPDPALSVRIEQVISGGPDGEIRYQVVLDGGRAHVERSPAARGDLVLRMSYEVAVAIAMGELSPHDAIQQGGVRVGGDLRRLPTLGALGLVSRALRDQTTYR
ncbi:MAG: SCP2 sterol-binding domain-containing protein [Acidimicrobiales bacterium]